MLATMSSDPNHRSEPNFAAAFRAFPGMLMLADPDLTIVGASDAYLDASGLQRERVIGRRIFEVFPDNPDEPGAVGEDELGASFERVFRDGVPDTVLAGTFDVERAEVDGGGIDTRSWLTHNVPVLDAGGDVVHVLSFVEDVTDTVHLDEADDEHERELATIREPARIAAAEYRRALRDYTQLVRHRLANPLTALTVGVATLRDLEPGLDSRTRCRILDSMAETALRLEQAVLHPDRETSSEGGLRSSPDVTGDVAGLVDVAAVKAEQHMRQINERMVDQLEPEPHRTIDFFCECWAPQCDGTITLPLHRYFAIHERPDQFVIRPGHELPSVEDVVERQSGFWVVRKRADVLEAADDV